MSDINKFREICEMISTPNLGYTEILDLVQSLQNITVSAVLFPSGDIKELFIFSMVKCIACPSITVRTAALRTTRIFLIEKVLLEELIKQNGHYFITKCLELSKQDSKERIQAFKLIKHILSIDSKLFPRCFTQSIIAIAKQKDDILYRVMLEFLAHLAINNPAAVYQCNGMEVLICSVIDFIPFYSIFQDALLVIITFLLTKPCRRKYISPNSIGTFVEPFTNTYTTREILQTRWSSAKSAIVFFLRSWTGVICFTNNPQLVKSLVQSLQLPDLELVKNLLDLFSKIFHLSYPSNKNPFENSRLVDEDLSEKKNITNSPQNLLDNYLAILLVIFKKAKLIENLVLVCTKMNARVTIEEGEECKAIAKSATCLIGNLLYLSNKLLPASLCADLQALPTLVNNAIDFNTDPRIRSLAGTTVSNLDKYAMIKRTKEREQTSKLDYFGDIKRKMDITMDDAVLRQKLNDSQVLVKKDYRAWRWDIISELVEGPFYHPPNFENPTSQKFISKILGFMLPSNKVFILIPYNSENKQTYANPCIQLLNLMISFTLGQQVLSSHKLLGQIRDLLKSELTGTKESHGPLSRDKLLRSMTLEYFTFIGLLSGSTDGLNILHKFQIFDILSQIDGREDLYTVVIKNLKYNSPLCPSRMLIANSLKAKSLVVRFLAMKQMGTLFKEGLHDFSQWCIVLLVQQLSDSDKKIANTALSILLECSEDPECLESIIARKPYKYLDALEGGKTLLVKLLSVPIGFNYLSTTNFISDELTAMKEGGKYITYVTQIDNALNAAFSAPIWKLKEGTPDTKVDLPSHFYGQLARTCAGIELLVKNGVFQWLIETLTSVESSDLEKRGVLWALGHIGSTRLGFKELIAKRNILPMLITLAESPCLPIRGTCFYVIGLISKSKSGSKALESMDWKCESKIGIAIPPSYKYFKIDSWIDVTPWPSIINTSELLKATEGDDQKSEVLRLFILLSNTIKADAALKKLKLLKETVPEIFTDIKLQFLTFQLLETYSYRLPARRVFYQIFKTHWKSEDIKALQNSKIKEIISTEEINHTVQLEHVSLKLSKRKRTSSRRKN